MVNKVTYEKKMTGLSGFPVLVAFSFYPCIDLLIKLQRSFTMKWNITYPTSFCWSTISYEHIYMYLLNATDTCMWMLHVRDLL